MKSEKVLKWGRMIRHMGHENRKEVRGRVQSREGMGKRE